MSEAIRQPGAAALPRPMGVGEILSAAFQLYRRHWRTLLTIAAVVVVPLTLLQYLFGDLVRTQGETTRNGVVETASWSVGIAGLVAALAGILMYLVLTGAITRAVAAEVAGQDPSGGPRPWVVPGGWSAATGGTPSAPWWWLACSPASSTP
jgi:hypothetical protein